MLICLMNKILTNYSNAEYNIIFCGIWVMGFTLGILKKCREV